MKKYFFFVFVLATPMAFADGVKVSEGSIKGCKGSAVSKSIRFYIGSAQPTKGFTRKMTWQNHVQYLKSTPTLTSKDIAYIGIPIGTTNEKSFKLVFTKSGSKKILAATQKNLKKNLVITVDDHAVLSVPIGTAMKDEVQVTDAIQTDGESLFTKMCPHPNVF